MVVPVVALTGCSKRPVAEFAVIRTFCIPLPVLKCTSTQVMLVSGLKKTSDGLDAIPCEKVVWALALVANKKQLINKLKKSCIGKKYFLFIKKLQYE